MSMTSRDFIPDLHYMIYNGAPPVISLKDANNKPQNARITIEGTVTWITESTNKGHWVNLKDYLQDVFLIKIWDNK